MLRWRRAAFWCSLVETELDEAAASASSTPTPAPLTRSAVAGALLARADARLVTVAGGKAGWRRRCPMRAESSSAGVGGAVGGRARTAPLLGAFRRIPRVLGRMAAWHRPAEGPGRARHRRDAIAPSCAEERVTLVASGRHQPRPRPRHRTRCCPERRVDRVMTGALSRGQCHPLREFNAWSEPSAGDLLRAAGGHARHAGAPAQALVRRRASRRCGAAGRACLAAAAGDHDPLTPSRLRRPSRHPMHDPCAVAWQLAPSLFTAARACEVESGSGARAPHRGGPLGRARGAQCAAAETLDAEGFCLLAAALAAAA